MKRIGLAFLFCTVLVPAAHADNVAQCEALIMKVIQDKEGQGEAQIASYRPAVHFLASLYDDEEGHLDHMSGFPIRAILCRRNNVIPAKSDYPIIATGIPFVLSQDFESGDTDSLTVYWKEDVLDYVYKGHPLSAGTQTELDARLADFTQRGKIEKTASEEKTSENTADDAPIEEPQEDVDIAVGETDVEIEYSSKTQAEMSLAPEAINSATIEAIGDADISLINNSETDTALIIEGQE